LSEEPRLPVSEIQVDRDNLYREEVFTDLRVATLRKLTPIKVDGSRDEGRPELWSAETQLMSQMGLIPIHAPIEAASLDEAIEKFPKAVAEAVERLVEEAREHQRREASRIVVPGQGGVPPIVPGGLPGVRGGKIDLK